MKKFFASILILTALASMLVAPVRAEENTPEEIKLMQQAVVETGMAYYRKRNGVDYDFATMTIRDRKTVGVAKMHAGAAPELASDDFIIYAHCADWINTVYMNAFNHIVGPSIWEAYVRSYNLYKSVNDPDVVLKYGGDGMKDRDEFAKKAREILQPGDIWSASGDPDYSNGHTMLYIGDYKGDGKQYVIHCSAGASDVDTGDPALDASGGIKMDTIDHFFADDKGWSIYHESYIQHVTIMRPINILKFEDMTTSAAVRIKYSMMDVDRQTDAFGYTSVENGQEVTLSLTVRNTGKQAYQDLTVKEPLPVGGEIVVGSVNEGGTLGADGVTWKINVPADGKVTLQYKIKVTAGLGEKLQLPMSYVDELPTRELSYTVRGKAANVELIDAVRKEREIPGVEKDQRILDLEFANVFYRNVLGVETGLPDTMQDLLDGLFDTITISGAGATGGYMLQPKAYESLTDEYKTIRDMILPDHMVGQVVFLGQSETTYYPVDRVTTYFEDSYEPGDIIVCLDRLNGSYDVAVEDPEQVSVYIYLGSGKVAAMVKKGLTVTNFENTIALGLRMNVLLALRPTLVNEDIMRNSTIAPTPVEPEVPETPAQPETPEVPETPAEPQPEPAETSGIPMGLIVGIAAAVVVIAAVAVLVLKKKKK